MRELFGSAMNLSLAEVDKGLEPTVEVILVLSEPVYEMDATGSLLRRRVLSQERFAASTEKLKKHIEQLQGFIKAGEDLADQVTVKKPDKS